MSEIKFAKGEWVAKDNGYYFDVHEVDESGYYLDQVCMGVSYENKGNVPLIATAPKMYELLDEVSHVLGHELSPTNKAYIKAIKELLAKARGES